MYLGEAPFGAFIEAFSQQIESSAWGVFVSRSGLSRSCLCPVSIDGSLRLVDVTTGPHLLAIGADERINSGPHSASQQWARAFREHPGRPDGIYYRSRRAPELFSIALFERSTRLLRTDCSANLLARDSDLATLLDYFDCALLP
jgi:hypothetical protein